MHSQLKNFCLLHILNTILQPSTQRSLAGLQNVGGEKSLQKPVNSGGEGPSAILPLFTLSSPV